MPSKKSLAKQEKQQAEKGEKRKREKREKIIGSIDIPNYNSNEVLDALKRMRAITPNGLANQFDLKVGVAKKILTELEDNGLISLVAKSSNVKVYAMNAR